VVELFWVSLAAFGPVARRRKGVESRWQLMPDHSADTDRWHLKHLRARTAPVAHWSVTRDAKGAPCVNKTPVPEPV